MNLNWFSHILVHHPYIIISAVAVISGTCLVIPFTLKTITFPNFQDPEMGFSTRGTTISNRLTAWDNLVKSTKQSGQFAINPKNVLIHRNHTIMMQAKYKTKQPKHNKKKKTKKKQKPHSSIFRNDDGNQTEFIDDDIVWKPKLHPNIFINEERNHTENVEADKWQKLKELMKQKNPYNFNQKPFNSEGFFCGIPDEKYAHVVIKSTNNKDIFSLESMMTICRLEYEFIEANSYKDLCIENEKSSPPKCCRPWSLPNYIALLHNRGSCLAITDEDIISTKNLLINCSHHFHNFDLSANCLEKDHCNGPPECMRHDAVFNIMNFLTSTAFLPPNSTSPPHTELYDTMIFLPLASSSAMLHYYHEIENMNFEYEGFKVVAMDFGIKRVLFDESLLRDAWLMGSGALFVFFCFLLYTESLFLTIMTIIAIVFSMAIAYFMYVLVFEIKFFPFMNLLTTVVAIGIGADDAFIFCKIWHIQKQEFSSSIVKLMSNTFHHAFISMFVTSLTTSVAFLGSYVSSVTAICCFSIFAGTAVVANYLLMITWFPACVVISQRSCCANVTLLKSCLMACIQRWCCKIVKPQWNLSSKSLKCTRLHKLWMAKENLLLESVIKLKYLWIVILFLLAVISAVIVLYYPKLQLPTSCEFQLFDISHPFEQYDFFYKNHFWFTREERMGEGINFKLPLRFIWGILPVDNGDHLDPANLGTLALDPTFDMSHPESQEYLRQFCENLREQPFYQPMLGPLLPNCFIETYIKSMQRKCVDDFTHKDRSPCCETAKFPFEPRVFNECIIEEMADIYETPSRFMMPGMAGPKFSKDQFPTIKAIIIEYDSNYSYSMSYEHMHAFYTQVESWMQSQLEKAPATMKNGWFVSELGFYDLQRELSESTQIAIAMSMGLAFIVLLISTLNILTSLYAILTITCSIFVAMAILVLLGWKLNILESVAVSTAIGLAVDFSLHYSVNYRLCPETIKKDREAATKFALSHMAGPALMAAITTGAAGAFMLPSLILPYIQIGIFLVIIMSVSWIYATFFLGSILAAAGPQNNFGQFTYINLISLSLPFRKSRSRQALPSSSGTTVSDTHELDTLTFKGVRASSKPLQRSLSSGGRSSTPNKYVFTDQSPSATSAITIIMADDN